MEQASSLKWSIKQRLDFVERRIFWEGRLNRADIMQAFDVSNLQATRDISLYQTLAPGNLVYDKSEKTYFPTSEFKAVLADLSTDAMLNELASGTQSEKGALVATPSVEELPIPRRDVPISALRAVLKAAGATQQILVYYQSMSRAEPVWRWIEPHALVYDGLRWQIRAYCCMTETFRDFLLIRILKVDDFRAGAGMREQDSDWNTLCEVVMVPHGDLSDSQKQVIEGDYKMQGGRLSLTVRRALVPYLFQRLNLSMAGKMPSEQQVEILNLDEIARLVSFKAE